MKQLQLSSFVPELHINGKLAFYIYQGFSGGLYTLRDLNGDRDKNYQGATPYRVWEYFRMDHPQFSVTLIPA
jgi:hypothetical protein